MTVWSFESLIRCYVAEDSRLGELVGYALFFNTIDEKGHYHKAPSMPFNPSASSSSSSFSQSSNVNSKQSTCGGGGSNTSSNGASAHLDDPVVVIEDLYIKPQYRGCGIATELWRKVLKVFNAQILLLFLALRNIFMIKYYKAQFKTAIFKHMVA